MTANFRQFDGWGRQEKQKGILILRNQSLKWGEQQRNKVLQHHIRRKRNMKNKLKVEFSLLMPGFTKLEVFQVQGRHQCLRVTTFSRILKIRALAEAKEELQYSIHAQVNIMPHINIYHHHITSNWISGLNVLIVNWMQGVWCTWEDMKTSTIVLQRMIKQKKSRNHIKTHWYKTTTTLFYSPLFYWKKKFCNVMFFN